MCTPPRSTGGAAGAGAILFPSGPTRRRGLFGEIHIVRSRLRHDVVAHELLHLWIEWLRARNVTITERNEENLALLYDELTRRFWRTVGEPKRRSTVTRSTAVKLRRKKTLERLRKFSYCCESGTARIPDGSDEATQSDTFHCVGDID